MRLSDHQAPIAVQGRSELRHHLLRDVDASGILFDSGFRYCRSGLHFWVQHRNVSGQRYGAGIDFRASVLQAPMISKYSQNHIAVPALFFVVFGVGSARWSTAELSRARCQSDSNQWRRWQTVRRWSETGSEEHSTKT